MSGLGAGRADSVKGGEALNIHASDWERREGFPPISIQRQDASA